MKRLAKGIFLDTSSLEVYITSFQFIRMFGDQMNDDHINMSTSELTKAVEDEYGFTGKTTKIEEGPQKDTPVRLHKVEELKTLSLWK